MTKTTDKVTAEQECPECHCPRSYHLELGCTMGDAGGGDCGCRFYLPAVSAPRTPLEIELYHVLRDMVDACAYCDGSGKQVLITGGGREVRCRGCAKARDVLRKAQE